MIWDLYSILIRKFEYKMIQVRFLVLLIFKEVGSSLDT